MFDQLPNMYRVINGGKSKWNEDQARAGTFFVRSADSNENHSSLSGEGANNSFDCDKEEADLVIYAPSLL